MRLQGRVLAGVFALLVPSLALAQTAGDWCNVERWGSESHSVAWNRMFRQTYDELRADKPGTAKKSAKRARKLLKQLIEAFVNGPSGSRFLGYTTYLLAVAEERLGELDDAAWDWQVAQNFAPELRGAYGDFPDAVPFLARTLLPESGPGKEAGSASSAKLPDGGPTVEELKAKTVIPPVCIHKEGPEYPLGARQFGFAGVSTVKAVIDRTGVVRSPTVEHGCGVTVLDVAALEAVRHWRYRPAMLDGKPIAVWLTVSVNFYMRK